MLGGGTHGPETQIYEERLLLNCCWTSLSGHDTAGSPRKLQCGINCSYRKELLLLT